MTVKEKYSVAYSVYETKKFDDFTFLEENRDVAMNHVNRLAQNIKEGYEMPPILVDEELKVIDGQHRLMAHEMLQRPIRFIIQENMKENTLQKANTNVKIWTTAQHIEYHIKKGNAHYIKLKAFREYSELQWGTAMRILGGSKDKKIKSEAKVLQYGLFEVRYEEDAYNFVDEVVLRMRMESPTSKIVSAIKNIYDIGVDTRRLVTAINVTEEEIQLMNTIPKIMETIAKIYNKDLKKSEHIKFKQWNNNQLKPYI
ncbi:ParB N-terminal domain-containing protein [Salinicoccus sesuvii]|uniref:ParB N-terminal domain-containing protein n=1 Tax=Salinicoccus sesuvii TaxID=868281 RepID=A0ABV7NAW4_9STAP